MAGKSSIFSSDFDLWKELRPELGERCLDQLSLSDVEGLFETMVKDSI
jgi:hypothetical protein